MPLDPANRTVLCRVDFPQLSENGSFNFRFRPRRADEPAFFSLADDNFCDARNFISSKITLAHF
jgi:hypothetical protein